VDVVVTAGVESAGTGRGDEPAEAPPGEGAGAEPAEELADGAGPAAGFAAVDDGRGAGAVAAGLGAALAEGELLGAGKGAELLAGPGNAGSGVPAPVSVCDHAATGAPSETAVAATAKR
jgi:hypothetical protein